MLGIHLSSNSDVLAWSLCLAGAFMLVWLGHGRWRVLGAVLLVLAALFPVAMANATTKIEGGPATVSNHRWCNWFRVKEQDYGLADNQLWDLQERVTWCHNRSKTQVNYLRRTWGYRVQGVGWKLVSHKLSGTRARDYSWYSRRVSAVFHGWAGPVYVECKPYIKIRTYATARVSYATGKGC